MKLYKIFVIAGEASGDRLAGNLLECLSRELPLQIYGTGGKYLKALGQKQYYSIESLEIIGIDGLLKKSIQIIKIFRDLINKVIQLKPDIILLVDYPGFNVRFARVAKKHNFKIIYYVAPQEWAWGYSRIYKLKNYVDLLLCILPFEAEIFAKAGINAIYVGNPVISRINYVFKTKSDFFSNISLNPSLYTIAVLPGSRKKEIENHMPAIAEAIVQLKYFQFIICKYSEISHRLIEKYVKQDKYVKIVEGLTYDCIKYADFAWVSSGTATLETAIINTPMLIFYKTSFTTYFLARLFLKIPYIGLPNIISAKKIIPELTGSKMKSKYIVNTFNFLKENTSSQVKHLKTIKENLFIPNIDPVSYARNIIKEFIRH